MYCQKCEVEYSSDCRSSTDKYRYYYVVYYISNSKSGPRICV